MDDFTPKYVLIQNYITNRINSGDLSVGDKIPSENELSQMFNVSRVTSNKAIAELEMMGIVERIRGKGTFVKTADLRYQGLTHVLSKSYKISSEISDADSHKLEKMELVKANAETVKLLHVKYGEDVYKITRIMYDSEGPIAIDYTYIPETLFNGSTPDEVKLSSYSVHEYLKLCLNLKPKYLHIHIDAKLPSNYEMRLLNIPKNKPIAVWDTNIIDEQNKSIAYTTTIANVDKYKPFINFELK